MISVQQAYVLGYFPQIIGFHFNGLEILNRLRREAQSPLNDRVSSLLESWPLRGPEIVDQVRRVEAILRLLGIPSQDPPKTAEEYFRWSESVMAITNQLLVTTAAPLENPVEYQLAMFRRKWTHAFATKLGDLLHTLNLGALVDYLRGTDMSHEFLTAQQKTLDEMAKEILVQLKMIEERTQFLRTFPEQTQQKIGEAIHRLEAAPAIVNSEDLDTTAAILQKIVSDTMKLDLEKYFNF